MAYDHIVLYEQQPSMHKDHKYNVGRNKTPWGYVEMNHNNS